MDQSAPAHRRTDGRLLRSERTRQALIEAYLDLLREKQRPPTAPEIAKRAGCSVRSVFERFSDLLTLSLAAADYAFEQGHGAGCGAKCRWRPADPAQVPGRDASRHLRADGCRCGARSCATKRKSEELAIRIERIRDAMVARLELVYRPELSTLSEAERKAVLVALEILTDFESWGRMRERSRPVDRGGPRCMDQCHRPDPAADAVGVLIRIQANASARKLCIACHDRRSALSL